ncbi:MAG TPA: NAD-dependent epimerase/dehydratase family protein [bacterium]|nr:NAD-dependent epimerase/dehydratase family protein [bacterium]
MKVLITGGAGFIGSHVADAHVAAGDEVVIVDNLSTGRRASVPERARFYELDIRSDAVREVFARERPDLVNHHAAQASVSFSVRHPQCDAEVNILGTLNVLAHCAEFGVRRVVMASTGGAIYGEPQRPLPVDETHPIEPLSPYGLSKYVGELYLRYLTAGAEAIPHRGRVSAAVLRYANVYGPRQDPHGEAGVVAIFAQAMLDRRAPTIFGDGTQTRDFVYVGDVARANVLAAAAGGSETVHIATGVETSVIDVYAALARFTAFAAPPAHGPARAGDVYRIALDAARARAWLGWVPQVTLEEGLRRTVDWFARRAPTNSPVES